MQVFNSSKIQGVPPTYQEKDPDFTEINRLDYNVYGLNGFYNVEEQSWEIRLFNIRTDSVLGKDSINYWFNCWNAYHQYVLDLPPDSNLWLIDYEDFRAHPIELLYALSDRMGIKLDAGKSKPFLKKPYPVQGVNPQLQNVAGELYHRLQQRKVNLRVENPASYQLRNARG